MIIMSVSSFSIIVLGLSLQNNTGFIGSLAAAAAASAAGVGGSYIHSS